MYCVLFGDGERRALISRKCDLSKFFQTRVVGQEMVILGMLQSGHQTSFCFVLRPDIDKCVDTACRKINFLVI